MQSVLEVLLLLAKCRIAYQALLVGEGHTIILEQRVTIGVS